MKAMILAAGRGQRLRPLTDHTPKPLLKIRGKAIIEHLIDGLKKAGIKNIIINHAYLGQQIVATLGNGQRYGVRLNYSPEALPGLETGGGIYNALPLLGNHPFIVVNGDLWTDFPFSTLFHQPCQRAHLVMVNNPSHHPNGDFSLSKGLISDNKEETLTFSGLGIYNPSLFTPDNIKKALALPNESILPARFPLKPLLLNAMHKQQVTGEHYHGEWVDVGNHARLSILQT